MARTSSQISAMDLQMVKLKKVGEQGASAPLPPPPKTQASGGHVDSFLRQAMNSRRAAAREDDTVDVTDAFS